MKRIGHYGKRFLAMAVAAMLLCSCASATDPQPAGAGGEAAPAEDTQGAAQADAQGAQTDAAGTDETQTAQEPQPAAADLSEQLKDTFWHNEQKLETSYGDPREIELFLFADGTVLYREPDISYDGRLYYDVYYATDSHWEADGDRIRLIFTRDWGEGDVETEEQELTYRDGTITFTDFNMYYEDGITPATIELAQAEMPRLPSLAEDFDKLEGDWVMVAGESEGYLFAAEEDGVYSDISIYRDGNDLKMDYIYGNDWGDEPENHQGLLVTGLDEPVYQGCVNGQWSASLSGESLGNETRRVTLLSDDELLYQEYGTYEIYEEDEYGDDAYGYIFYAYYLREGSEACAKKDEYFYYNTVEVSTVHELAAALQDHTHVILQSGVYNFSDLFYEDALANPRLDVEWSGFGSTWTINYPSYLLIEAAPGTKVEICTENAYAPVLNFVGGDHITVRGVTCGHHVEPGNCIGSVIHAENANQVKVENCDLYGSGTYGVELQNVYNAYVTDSKIYDCTYGGVDLESSSFVEVTDCEIYDCREYNMVYMSRCSNVTFRNVTARDNDFQYGELIYNYTGYSILFENCTFQNNRYQAFVANYAEKGSTAENVVFENCTGVE